MQLHSEITNFHLRVDKKTTNYTNLENLNELNCFKTKLSLKKLKTKLYFKINIFS